MPSAINLQTLIPAALAVLLVLWLIGVTAGLLRLSRTRRGLVSGLRAATDVEGLLSQMTADISQLSEDGTGLAQQQDDQRKMLAATTSRLGLVRYDAFEGVGGKLSFSAALLNERGDGLILTSINGRNEGRVYAKPVTSGRSEHTLSSEELEAIETALEDGRP